MTIELIRAQEDHLTSDQIEKLGKLLREGELVALPTETVYGIAARSDSKEALEKLIALKGREESKFFTVHLADPEQASQFSKSIHPLAKKLMDRYWPGPLTLILPNSNGEGVGLRVPAKELTRSVLRSAGVPVVMSSANRSGEEPAIQIDQVLAAFPQGVRAAVDAGPCVLAQSSTVLRFLGEKLEILREGIITIADIRQTIGKRILFLCSGNTCRSPMAEGLAKAAIAKKYSIPIQNLQDFGFQIRSAGIAASDGGFPSPQGVSAMAERNIDISTHRSRPLRRNMISEADAVYAMSDTHLLLAFSLDPASRDKIRLLDSQESEIPDPFAGTIEDYRECRDRIDRCIQEIVERI